MTAHINNIVRRRFKVEQPIDMHCHGIGRFDFTDIASLDFQEIEDALAKRKHKCILTLYLPQTCFNDFLYMMDVFSEGYHGGSYPHIAGIGLEGPLLASFGGTPDIGAWIPTKREWLQLASCGKKGLVYMIWSPGMTLAGQSLRALSSLEENTKWLASTLLDKGVLPAAGHFNDGTPEQVVAKALQEVYNCVEAWGCGPTLTDHLYNDMPHNFIHAWRTNNARAQREKELAEQELESWTLDNIDEKLGFIPATMMRNALEGRVKIAMNFDGEHVDLAIVKRTIDLVGAENIVMMTDSIESRRLAGRNLNMKADSTLLYQKEGVVAAGTQDIEKQISNMVSMGLTHKQIQLITVDVPSQLLDLRCHACLPMPHAQA